MCSPKLSQMKSSDHSANLATGLMLCFSCREYCRRVLRKSPSDCAAYTLSFDTSVFIIESTRRRVAVEATLENKGENAYSTVLNISFSRNLQFASLIQKVRTPLESSPVGTCVGSKSLPVKKEKEMAIRGPGPAPVKLMRVLSLTLVEIKLGYKKRSH